jgi:hypothetical protein
MVGWPSIIHSATYFPAPPRWRYNGIESSRDKEISHSGALHDKIVVGCEAFRAIHEFGEADFVKRGMRHRRERLGEFLPIRFRSWKENLSGIVSTAQAFEGFKMRRASPHSLHPENKCTSRGSSDRKFVNAGDWLSNYVMMFD